MPSRSRCSLLSPPLCMADVGGPIRQRVVQQPPRALPGPGAPERLVGTRGVAGAVPQGRVGSWVRPGRLLRDGALCWHGCWGSVLWGPWSGSCGWTSGR